jgi:hypothetical protein
MILTWCDPAERRRQEEVRSQKRTSLAIATLGLKDVVNTVIGIVVGWLKSAASFSSPSISPARSVPIVVANDHKKVYEDVSDRNSVVEATVQNLHEDVMIPEREERKLDVQKNLILSICKCVGMLLHYADEDQWHTTDREQCFYDIYSLVTTAFCIFRRIVPSIIPVSDFDQPTTPLRVRVALLASFDIAMKFEDDFRTVIPSISLFRQLITAKEAASFVTDDDVIHAIVYMETQIVGSVNVFEVSQYNHHRKAVEALVQMADHQHVDCQSVVRATAVSFFFVFNTYGRVEQMSKSYDTYTIGKAIAIAILFCLECAGLGNTPTRRSSARLRLKLALLILKEIALKGEVATKEGIGGVFVDSKTWEYKATQRDTINDAIGGITSLLKR